MVPEGDLQDKTRDSSKYDSTWNHLKEVGIANMVLHPVLHFGPAHQIHRIKIPTKSLL